MRRRPVRWRGGKMVRCLAGTVLVPVIILIASSQSAGASLLSDARAARTRLEAVRASGKWDVEAETRLVEDIERIASRYLRLVEVGTGNLTALSRSVRRLLEKAQENYAGKLESWQARIIEEDGDLEAAQDQPEWQQREVLAVRVQYWLNWVYYLAASRFEKSSGERRHWLEKAMAGFSNFALQEEDVKLAAESLYGRGLAARELGRYRQAAGDLRHALTVAPSSGLRLKVRLALIELMLDRKDYLGALKASEGIVKAGGASKARRELLRMKTIMLALKAGSAGKGRRGDRLRREALTLLEDLNERGGFWGRKARETFLALAGDQEHWKGAASGSFVKWLLAEGLRGEHRYEAALGLYRELLKGEPPAATTKAKLLLASGICSYRLERYQDAYNAFDKAVAAMDGGSAVDDAAYLRFKAAEALYFARRTRDRELLLRRAIESYLSLAPGHRYGFEAYYRLAEILDREGEFLRASSTFAKVKGDARFTLKAKFLAAQAVVKELNRRWEEGGGGSQDEKLIDLALGRINDFKGEVKRFDELHKRTQTDRSLIVPMEVKSALMAAKLKKRKRPSDWQGILDVLSPLDRGLAGYPDLRAEVLAARAEALLRLGRLEAARRSLNQLLGLPQAEPAAADLVRGLGVVCLEVAEKARSRKEFEAARDATAMALDIYQTLLAAADRERMSTEKLAGLEALVSQLKREVQAGRLGSSAGQADLSP